MIFKKWCKSDADSKKKSKELVGNLKEHFFFKNKYHQS
jgi:hypothetical protein